MAAETAQQDAERLPIRTLLAFSIPAIPVSFLYYVFVVMYLYFATVKLGASPGVIGAIFFASKVWDGISDPIVGFLSDRTRSRFGRRKIWLLGSAIPLALFGWMLWAPPAFLSASQLEIWIAIAIFAFYTAFTAFEVPHMSLGAELTFDPIDRTRVYGARQYARVATMLVAYTGGVYVVQSYDPIWSGRMAIACAVLTVVAIGWGVLRLPPERADHQGRGPANPFRAVVDVWSNPHARLLLFVFFVESIGAGGIGVMVPFVIEFVMKLDGGLWLPGMASADALALPQRGPGRLLPHLPGPAASRRDRLGAASRVVSHARLDRHSGYRRALRAMYPRPASALGSRQRRRQSDSVGRHRGGLTRAVRVTASPISRSAGLLHSGRQTDHSCPRGASSAPASG